MSDPFLTLQFFGYELIVTPWKMVGYLGIALFGGRWIVQSMASRLQGKPVMPRLFWYMSILGSLLCCSYFIWGKNDSVGILSYLFPTLVAMYNLYLDIKSSKEENS